MYLLNGWIRGLVLFTTIALPSLGFAMPIHYVANLGELNNSGVSGQANLYLDGDSLTVNIHATGLEPGQVHPQHIHGLLDATGNPINSTSPTIAQDTDKDGFVELAEAAPTYGPVLIPLTSPPGGALANFPTAPNGIIDFSQTYDLTDSAIYNNGFNEADVLPLDLREIVLHGMSVGDAGAGTPGEVDGTAGYKPTLPVASGELVLATPEPATVGMMALGLIGILGLAIRARKGS